VAGEKEGIEMSDTPISDSTPHNAADLGMLCRRLERELNRACEMYRKLDIHTLDLVDRIIRLEAAGDAMERLLPDGSICDKVANLWRKAKEAKP
jgi:hypothetical protein